LEDRIKFVREKESEKGGFNKLPSEAMEKLQEIIVELK
jgi:phosphoenolpyruvate carboxykinase (ATP)